MSSAASQLPSLTSWFQTNIAALYDLSASNFTTTFDSTFSSNADISVNFSSVPRDTLRDDISAQKAAATNVTLEWKDTIEVPAAEGEKASEAGIVAGYLVITRSLRFRIRAAPAQTQTFIVFNAKIEQDPTAQSGEQGDRRRIVNLIETTLNKAPPINLPTPHNV